MDGMLLEKTIEKIVISSRVHKHETLFNQFQETFRNDLDLVRVRGRTISHTWYLSRRAVIPERGWIQVQVSDRCIKGITINTSSLLGVSTIKYR